MRHLIFLLFAAFLTLQVHAGPAEDQAAFFRRHGTSMPPSQKPADYRPGDIVTWRLQGGLNHIGIVADKVSPAGIPLVIHNIGDGTQLEDILFAYPVTGHFRYLPLSAR